MNVKLYKIECEQAYQMAEQGVYFSLVPWGQNTSYYEGNDDGGKEYELPEGYEVAETNAGDMGIYKNDRHCPIIKHSSGLPQLVYDTHEMPVLKLAPIDNRFENLIKEDCPMDRDTFIKKFVADHLKYGEHKINDDLRLRKIQNQIGAMKKWHRINGIDRPGWLSMAICSDIENEINRQLRN